MRPVETNDPRPPFVQIADDLRAQIESGELAQGARLTSGRALAKGYGVATMTVRNALLRLCDEGRIYTTGRGYFVGSPPQPEKVDGAEPLGLVQRLDKMESEMHELRSRVETLESGQ